MTTDDRAPAPTPATPPGTPDGPPEDPATATDAGTGNAPAPADRRRRRAALVRWTAAVLVFAATATATAYGLTRADRADLPGLATRSDGRWDYPRIERPALPEGAPAPFAASNEASVHHAALRGLLLPAPRGAKPDPDLRAREGWLTPAGYARLFARPEHRAEVRQHLADHAVRRVAARGWTTPDGTRTRIYLLRFGGVGMAESWRREHGWDENGSQQALLDAHVTRPDKEYPEEAHPENVRAHVFTEVPPHGREHTRLAFLEAGDVVGLVVQSRAGGVRDVPFQQTVVLQGQLLG
ncbi:hypothetical protein JNUCC64_15335 [Streptomyces sp. JNUCC 64]